MGVCDERLTAEDIDLRLLEAQVPESDVSKVRRALLWFAFLGVSKDDKEVYSCQMFYNQAKLESLVTGIGEKARVYVIHPAFRRTLGGGHTGGGLVLWEE